MRAYLGAESYSDGLVAETYAQDRNRMRSEQIEAEADVLRDQQCPQVVVRAAMS